MKNPADEKLKAFLLENLDFDCLKEMGFWPTGTRRADYAAQAARICQYFGYETVYEYGRSLDLRETDCPTVLAGGFAAEVDAAGALQPGGGFLLSVGPSTAFVCPVCECPQDANDFRAFQRKPTFATVRCRGCKRKLTLSVPLFSSVAALQVNEA